MALRNLKFIETAYASVGNMHAAMNALDKGVLDVKNLASQWGVQLSDGEAQELVAEFAAVKDKPIVDLGTVKAC